MSEYNVAAEWLWATLRAHAPLMALVTGVYNGNVPLPGPLQPPYVIFDYRGGSYTWVQGGRLALSGLWAVRGVVRGRDLGNLSASIASAIDDAIELGSGPATGGSVIGCSAEEPYINAETRVDPPYVHNGHYYRIESQEA